ncbi:hypothetical protein VKT23_013945 [Stygiomarasmius scandens]|uniref:Uncharacterized protein n=1 Tax=Marasmiellus scandens TaxID=2682957 RepID=A0ABR1J1X5_9AGAR
MPANGTTTPTVSPRSFNSRQNQEPEEPDEWNGINSQDPVTQLASDVLRSTMSCKRKQSNGSDKDEENAEEPSPWSRYGRNYLRQVALFTPLDHIVNHGIKKEAADSESEESEDEDEPIKQQRLCEDWEILCKIIPAFKESVLQISNKPTRIAFLCSQMSKIADRTRGNDTSGLKASVASYLLHDTSTTLPQPLSNEKHLRGFRHPITASLLTPAEYDDNPDVHLKCEQGEKRITANRMPRMLYPDSKIFDNDSDYETNLLEGHYPIRALEVARHIYMGPQSTLMPEGVKVGRRGNASIVGITTMTPRTIAYAVVQARFAISQGPEWSRIENQFDYEKFYWNIVEHCENHPEVISLYNRHLFGSPGGSLTNHDHTESDEDEEMTSMSRIRAERAKRRRIN